MVTKIDASMFDAQGKEIILDADADTSITADTDDQIDIRIAGADDFRFTANNMNVLSGSTLTIDSGATITNSGTATGFGVALANDGDNRVVTGTGSGGLNGEANLSFDGTTLAITGTVEPSGDTSAGDNAAIGYTAAEGLILTGQGSTDDITIKNDADTTVVNVATGATDVEISAGNILFGTAAKGVYLGVTSANAANLLDDYEEGTWTPVLGGTGGTSGQTYNYQTGTYTKIGRWIHCVYTIGLTNKGTITTTLALQGLPFTSGTAAGYWDQGAVIPAYSDNITCTADHTLVGRIRINESDIVWQEKDWAADNPTNLTTSNVDSGTTYLYGSFSYHIQ